MDMIRPLSNGGGRIGSLEAVIKQLLTAKCSTFLSWISSRAVVLWSPHQSGQHLGRGEAMASQGEGTQGVPNDVAGAGQAQTHIPASSSPRPGDKALTASGRATAGPSHAAPAVETKMRMLGTGDVFPFMCDKCGEFRAHSWKMQLCGFLWAATTLS
ncbi:hypothetical protein AAFF_G00414360 [Aldrovandia affinis]|uniref:Uncharacterized protein n=1 Tax=Aldrovandia affinis TaxID=143900 RepID=A0AAD7WJC4_9TELE|nr:hypothetical protein AAFF_G00414360 [Aldrovandia affinis]